MSDRAEYPYKDDPHELASGDVVVGPVAEAASDVAPPAQPVTGVAQREQQRADTLRILDDPHWPGDGARGPEELRSAMWWCVGAAVLLAFPRQYWAAIGAAALALVFLLLLRRSKRASSTGRQGRG